MRFKQISHHTTQISILESRFYSNWQSFMSNQRLVRGLEDAPKLLYTLAFQGHHPLKVQGSLLTFIADPQHQSLPNDADIKVEMQDLDDMKTYAHLLESLGLQQKNNFQKGTYASRIYVGHGLEIELVLDPENTLLEKGPQVDYEHASLSLEVKAGVGFIAPQVYGQGLVATLSSKNNSLPEALQNIHAKVATPCKPDVDLIRVIKMGMNSYTPIDGKEISAARQKFIKDLTTMNEGEAEYSLISRQKKTLGLLVRKIIEDYSHRPYDGSGEAPMIMGLKEIFQILIRAKSQSPEYDLKASIDYISKSIMSLTDIPEANHRLLQDFATQLQPLSKASFEGLNTAWEAVDGITKLTHNLRLHEKMKSGVFECSAEKKKRLSDLQDKIIVGVTALLSKSTQKKVIKLSKVLGEFGTGYPSLKHKLDFIFESLKTKTPPPLLNLITRFKALSPDAIVTPPATEAKANSKKKKNSNSQTSPHPIQGVFQECCTLLMPESDPSKITAATLETQLKTGLKGLDLMKLTQLQCFFRKQEEPCVQMYQPQIQSSKRKKGKGKDDDAKVWLNKYKHIFSKPALKKHMLAIAEAVDHHYIPQTPPSSLTLKQMTLKEFADTYQGLFDFLDKEKQFLDQDLPSPKIFAQVRTCIAQCQNMIRHSLSHLMATREFRDGMKRDSIFCEMVEQNHYSLWQPRFELSEDDLKKNYLIDYLYLIIKAVVEAHEAKVDNEKERAVIKCFDNIHYDKEDDDDVRILGALFAWAICHLPQKSRVILVEFCLNDETQWHRNMPKAYHNIIYKILKAEALNNNSDESCSFLLLEKANGSATKAQDSIITLPHPTLNATMLLNKAQVKTALDNQLAPGSLQPIELSLLKTFMDPVACEAHLPKFSEQDRPHCEKYVMAYKAFQSILNAKRLKNPEFPPLTQPYLDNFMTKVFTTFQSEHIDGLMQEHEILRARQPDATSQLSKWLHALKSVIKVYCNPAESRIQQEGLIFLKLIELCELNWKSLVLIEKVTSVLESVQDDLNKLNKPAFFFHITAAKFYEIFLNQSIKHITCKTPSDFFANPLHLFIQKQQQLCELTQAQMHPLLHELFIQYPDRTTPMEGKSTRGLNVFKGMHMLNESMKVMAKGGKIFNSMVEIKDILQAIQNQEYGGMQALFGRRMTIHFLRNLPTSEIQTLSNDNQTCLYVLIAGASPIYYADQKQMASTFVIWQLSMMAFLKHQNGLKPENVVKVENNYLSEFKKAHAHGNASVQRVTYLMDKMKPGMKTSDGAPDDSSLSALLGGLWLDFCDLFDDLPQLEVKLNQLQWALDSLFSLTDNWTKERVINYMVTPFLNNMLMAKHKPEKHGSQNTQALFTAFFEHFGCNIDETTCIDAPTLPSLDAQLDRLTSQTPPCLGSLNELLKKISLFHLYLKKEDRKPFLRFLHKKLIPSLTGLTLTMYKEGTTKVYQHLFLQLDFHLIQLCKWVGNDAAKCAIVPIRHCLSRGLKISDKILDTYRRNIPKELSSKMFTKQQDRLSPEVIRLYELMKVSIPLPLISKEFDESPPLDVSKVEVYASKIAYAKADYGPGTLSQLPEIDTSGMGGGASASMKHIEADSLPAGKVPRPKIRPKAFARVKPISLDSIGAGPLPTKRVQQEEIDAILAGHSLTKRVPRPAKAFARSVELPLPRMKPSVVQADFSSLSPPSTGDIVRPTEMPLPAIPTAETGEASV